MSDFGPGVLWQIGNVQCVVIHSSAAQSYEVRIMQAGQVIERRWFADYEHAANFAAQKRRKYQALT